MMGHSHNMASTHKGQWLVVTDNFYTRHHLENALLQFTDDVRIFGNSTNELCGLCQQWQCKEGCSASERSAMWNMVSDCSK